MLAKSAKPAASSDDDDIDSLLSQLAKAEARNKALAERLDDEGRKYHCHKDLKNSDSKHSDSESPRPQEDRQDRLDGDGWDSDGLGYHTPGDDEGGDMEMPEEACDDCGPLRDRPASASAVAARGKHSRTGCTPITASESVNVAARWLNDLAHGVLGPALTLGSRAGRENRKLQ